MGTTAYSIEPMVTWVIAFHEKQNPLPTTSLADKQVMQDCISHLCQSAWHQLCRPDNWMLDDAGIPVVFAMTREQQFKCLFWYLDAMLGQARQLLRQKVGLPSIERHLSKLSPALLDSAIWAIASQSFQSDPYLPSWLHQELSDSHLLKYLHQCAQASSRQLLENPAA